MWHRCGFCWKILTTDSKVGETPPMNRADYYGSMAEECRLMWERAIHPAEAVRKALPELLKLDRYERRTAARRDRASRHIKARKILLDKF